MLEDKEILVEGRAYRFDERGMKRASSNAAIIIRIIRMLCLCFDFRFAKNAPFENLFSKTRYRSYFVEVCKFSSRMT